MRETIIKFHFLVCLNDKIFLIELYLRITQNDTLYLMPVHSLML